MIIDNTYLLIEEISEGSCAQVFYGKFYKILFKNF